MKSRDLRGEKTLVELKNNLAGAIKEIVAKSVREAVEDGMRHLLQEALAKHDFRK